MTNVFPFTAGNQDVTRRSTNPTPGATTRPVRGTDGPFVGGRSAHGQLRTRRPGRAPVSSSFRRVNAPAHSVAR